MRRVRRSNTLLDVQRYAQLDCARLEAPPLVTGLVTNAAFDRLLPDGCTLGHRDPASEDRLIGVRRVTLWHERTEGFRRLPFTQGLQPAGQIQLEARGRGARVSVQRANLPERGDFELDRQLDRVAGFGAASG